MNTPTRYASDRAAVLAAIAGLPAIWQANLADKIVDHLSRVSPPQPEAAPARAQGVTVTEEMVERACEARHGKGFPSGWDQMGATTMELYRQKEREVLTAALAVYPGSAPGWLYKQLEAAAAEVATWPAEKRARINWVFEESDATLDGFRVGDKVERHAASDYKFPGTVVAVLTKLSGERRYVVEDDRGTLFVQSDKTLVRTKQL